MRSACGFWWLSPHPVIAQNYGCDCSVESDKARFRNGTLAALDEAADLGRVGNAVEISA